MKSAVGCLVVLCVIATALPGLANAQSPSGPCYCASRSHTIWSTTKKECVPFFPTPQQQQTITACSAKQQYVVLKGSASNSPVACTADGGSGVGGNPVIVSVANGNILSDKGTSSAGSNVGNDAGSGTGGAGGSNNIGNNGRKLLDTAPGWGPSLCASRLHTVWSTTKKQCVPFLPTPQQKQTIAACTASQQYVVLKGSASNSPVACSADGGSGMGGNPVIVSAANGNIASPDATSSAGSNVGNNAGSGTGGAGGSNNIGNNGK